MTENPTLSVIEKIPLSRIADLLCCAFDPVSRRASTGYWCDIIRYEKPPTITTRFATDAVYPYCDYPLSKGGALILKVNEDPPPEHSGDLRLDLAALKKGAQIMSTDYPQQWAEFLKENEDIGVADVFIQCCVLGDVIYG